MHIKVSDRIQRLVSPFDDPEIARMANVMDCSLPNYGLPEPALAALDTAFHFDGMGDMSYDLRIAPAIAVISEAAQKQQLGIDRIYVEAIATGIDSELCRPVTVMSDAGIDIIAPRNMMEQAFKCITDEAIEANAPRHERPTHFAKSASGLKHFERNSMTAKLPGGWLELDNGFFFFTNQSMFFKTGQLFGLGKEIQYSQPWRRSETSEAWQKRNGIPLTPPLIRSGYVLDQPSLR